MFACRNDCSTLNSLVQVKPVVCIVDSCQVKALVSNIAFYYHYCLCVVVIRMRDSLTY